jgi:hypothetical protein
LVVFYLGQSLKQVRREKREERENVWLIGLVTSRVHQGLNGPPQE